MKKILRFAPVLAAALAIAAVFATRRPAASEPGPESLPDFSLTDVAGAARSRGDLRGSPCALVFVSTQCPVSNRYVAELAAIHREFGGRVAIWGVNPNPNEQSEAAAHANERAVPFPILLDGDHALADALGIDVTPTAIVADAQGRIVYRGRIDDDPMNGRPARRELREALEAVLAGKAPAVAETEATGCVVRRATPAADGPVTYARDVAPILNSHCVTCHRAGQIGPMPLTDYEHASAFAKEIRDAVRARRMPPWKPTGGVAMQGERKLTEAQIATLSAWSDGGAPRGRPEDEPALPDLPEGGWLLGEPDLVLEPEADLEIPAADGAPDQWHYLVFPTNLPKDRWVAAAEVLPGNPRVVHHVVGMVDTSGVALELDAKDPAAGYSGTGTSPGFVPVSDMGGWTPGMVPKRAPDGIARKLPKGATIVLQMHYSRVATAQKDRTRLGIYFAKEKVRKQVRLGGMASRDFVIPAGKAEHPVSASWTVPKDLTLISVMPHMHLIGRRVTMSAVFPDGATTSLLEISDWDFKWQDSYLLAEPLKIPKNSKLVIDVIYDNSAENPRNPHKPPVDVRFGQRTEDEMCLGIVAYTLDEEDMSKKRKKKKE